jgi:hypothetical protein
MFGSPWRKSVGSLVASGSRQGFDYSSEQMKAGTVGRMAMVERNHGPHQSTIWIATSDLAKNGGASLL